MDKASKGFGSDASEASSAGALTEAASEKRLLTLVEAEIIPRLMLAHRDPRNDARDHAAVQPDEVVDFARTLMAQKISDATELIGQLCERGVSMEAIYLQLLAPAARYLGELWEADQCNFSEVTLCLWRMQTLMYDLSAAFHGGDARPARGGAERRILMASLPGQQHTFGLSMLSEFFRKDGWVVLAIPSPQAGEVLDTLSMHWFDVLALSASMDGEAKELGKTIKAARKTSRNPRLAVMVGGPLFLRQPQLAEAVGADGMSEDAPSALALAARLVQHQQEVRLN